ncbi:uncharacterized protein DS421_4g126420 [Arachis hypogaea]|nr:uncharacterized protein DS421_4g126420 [Arachis hypogaea]
MESRSRREAKSRASSSSAEPATAPSFFFSFSSSSEPAVAPSSSYSSLQHLCRSLSL